MATFYRPDNKSEQVYTAEGKPVDYATYKQMGGVGQAGQGAFADVKYAPLPTLTPSAPVAPQSPVQDPVGKFNMGIYELLKRAQSTDNSALYNERNRLAVGQTEASMAPANEAGLQGLTPDAALAARGRASNLYNPEIRNLTDRIQASVQAVDKFESAIKAAKEYGAEYAKNIKPDEQTIKAVQEMLIAGETPSKDVLDSVSKYIDWSAVGEAKKKPKKSEQDIVLDYLNDYKDAGILPTDSLAVAQEKLKNSKIYQDRVRGPQGPGTTQTERNQSKQAQVISDAQNALDRERQNSSDGKANPNTYRKYKTQYINAGGTSTDWFQAVPVEVYINKGNQVGDLAQKSADNSTLEALRAAGFIK